MHLLCMCLCLKSESGHASAGADSTGEKKDKGPTGKQFFRQLEADAKAKVSAGMQICYLALTLLP